MFEDHEEFKENDGLPNRVEEALEAYQKMMMRRLVEENYDRISTKGFSEIELLAENLCAIVHLGALAAKPSLFCKSKSLTL